MPCWCNTQFLVCMMQLFPFINSKAKFGLLDWAGSSVLSLFENSIPKLILKNISKWSKFHFRIYKVFISLIRNRSYRLFCTLENPYVFKNGCLRSGSYTWWEKVNIITQFMLSGMFLYLLFCPPHTSQSGSSLDKTYSLLNPSIFCHFRAFALLLSPFLSIRWYFKNCNLSFWV